MFHRIKTVAPMPDFMLLVHFADGTAKSYDVKKLIDTVPVFRPLRETPGLFVQASADSGGYGVSWNDEIDIACDELWENGKRASTPFDNLMAFSDATELWGLRDSTLRKAVAYGKLKEGIDVQKFGKQWVVTSEAMEREYGKRKAEA